MRDAGKAGRAACATMALVALSVLPASARTSPVVTWTEGRLTVHALDAPLIEVMAEVARLTGVEIIGSASVDGTCSIAFVDKPLVEGLRLLLADTSYVIAGAAPDRVAPADGTIRIWLHPREAAPEPTAPASGAADVEEADEGEGPPTEGGEPVDPDQVELQRLEGAGFFDEATPGRLVDAAQFESTAVRVQALRTLDRRDPSISIGVLADAVSDPDAAVSSTATELLAERDDPETVERLGGLLQSPNAVIRFTALELLRRRADAKSLGYVRQALEDENDAIRTTAENLVKELERQDEP